MISPRTIFNRKPFGKIVLQNKYAHKENYHDINDKMELCDDENNEFWIVRTVFNQQLELYVRDCGAVLHNFTSQDNSHMLTGYTDTPIKCASFVCLSQKVSTNATLESIFQDLNSSNPKGFILFTEYIAKYYGFDAEIHSCKLPCPVSSAWSFRNCVFVEREASKQVNEYSPHSLFLMSHTLAEFTPVIFKDEFGNCGFINDTRFRIVAVCEISFLLIAYDTIDNTFSLWRVRDAIREDFENLYAKHWDGSISIKRERLHSNSFSVPSNGIMTNHSLNGHNSSHVSAEYFEIGSNSGKKLCSKTIDDLDTRSPMARSMRNTADAKTADKMTLLHDISNSSKINSTLRQQMGEPLFPKVCLDFLFQLKSPANVESFLEGNPDVRHSTPVINGAKKLKFNKKSLIKSHANAFFAEDFYHRKYLCCMTRTTKTSVNTDEKTLHIIKYNYDNNCFNHLDEHNYQVLDAVYLSKLQLIIMLELNSTLSIYTGLSFMCKISLLNSLIYEPDLFAEDIGIEMSTDDINTMIRLSEPTDYGFTIHTRSQMSLRLYLPEMVRFHLVKKCLLVLKKLLPINIGMTLLCRWYSLNRAVDNNEATSAEWRRFVEFLLENLGFIKTRQQDHSIVRDVKDLCLNNCTIGPMDITMDNSMDMSNDTMAMNNDVSMEDICIKKLRMNTGLYSIENRCINRDRLQQYTSLTNNVADRLLSRYATTVLFSLHLVYESEKINYSSCLYLDNLAALNCSLACSIESANYIEYYVVDNPDIWSRVNKLPSLVNYISITDNAHIWTNCPPDWIKWFTSILVNNDNNDNNNKTNVANINYRYPIIEDLSEMIMHLFKIWLVMFHSNDLINNGEEILNRYLYRINYNISGIPCQYAIHLTSDITNSIDKRLLHIDNLFERVASYLGEISFHIADLDYINSGFASIFKTIFFHCNKYPHLYSILHRSDLDKQRQLIMPIIAENSVPEVLTNPLQTFRTLSQARRNCYSYWTNNVKPCTIVGKLGELVHRNDNHYLLAILDSDPIVQLSYPDMRIHEAYKMLQSCYPIELDVTICAKFDTADGDSLSAPLKEELESYLKIINCQRTFALPIGRGMLGLQVVQSNWMLGDKLPVAQLCLTGKLSLSESGKPKTIENNTSTKQWPNFHNGVAAGLMMGPLNDSVDSVWILKQCSSNNLDKIDLTPEQAGILLGLGLNGHLNKLSYDTIGQTIKSMNEMATMAILIGLSAFNLGSKNSVLSKHISFHYRRLIPGEKDQNDPIPTLCQVSAIISAGLLNFKSGDRKMAKIFIKEMGRCRENLLIDGSPPLDIELTSVTAGFSVGLIMFQQGDLLCREYNADELLLLMSYLKGTYRLPSNDNNFHNNNYNNINGGTNYNNITSMMDTPTDCHIKMIVKNHDVKRPQPISEVDNWNVLQQKNPRVLEGEYYNMDITGCGAAVAIGLIFMDSSNDIIARQLQCPDTFYLLEQIRSPILCFRQIAYHLIMWKLIQPTIQWVDSTIPQFISSNAFVNKPIGLPDKYVETANDSYLLMLVGSCFAMGLRYAGTNNDGARDTIMSYIDKLLSIKKDGELYQNINRNQYDWALSNLFLSACMIAAGSGDLKLLQLSRYFRTIHLPKDCANYGVNMTYSMSIGLLFLGGGKLTLSNTPRCAAILLISFFPRFPPTYSGRRYHLQSLRHLYVIATRPRVMCAVDLDTQTAVPIQSKITFKNGESRECNNSFVYPAENPRLIDQIELYDTDGKYWPQIYKPGSQPWTILLQSLQSGGYFFVKKRSSEKQLCELVDEFRVEKLTHGYNFCDYRLFVDFIFSSHDTDDYCDLPFNVMKIGEKMIDYIMCNRLELKQLFNHLKSINISNSHQILMFINWCHDNNLLHIWSALSSYFNISIHILKEILSNNNTAQFILSEEAQFLINEINFFEQ